MVKWHNLVPVCVHCYTLLNATKTLLKGEKDNKDKIDYYFVNKIRCKKQKKSNLYAMCMTTFIQINYFDNNADIIITFWESQGVETLWIFAARIDNFVGRLVA